MNSLIFFGMFVFALFVLGTIKKLAYAAKVEDELRKLSISPLELQKIVSKRNYSNALFLMKRNSISPENAAGLLKLYVIQDYGTFLAQTSTTEPFEISFLIALGYISP